MLSTKTFGLYQRVASTTVRNRVFVPSSLSATKFSNVTSFVPSAQLLRHFSSNDDFKNTINRMRQGLNKPKSDSKDESQTAPVDAKVNPSVSMEGEPEKMKEGETDSDKKAEETDNETKENDAKSEDQAAQSGPRFTMPTMPKIDLYTIRDFSIRSYDFVVDNVKLAYSEMIGESGESRLTRKVHQAETYKRAKKKDEDEEDDDDLTEAEIEAREKKRREEAGPSAIVLVKEPQSPWEAMRERLQDSPLIREILKNSRKIGKQAAATDLGKQVSHFV
jgi:hypothetical protein